MRKITQGVLPIIILSGVLVLIGTSIHSYELDEAFSLYISKNWDDMTRLLWNKESNMWLYYIVLHYWQKLGTGEIMVRSLSATFSLMSLLVIYKIAEHLFEKKIATLSTFLMSINMYFIFYASQARSYSLALFLICLSMYLYLKNLKVKKMRLAYVVVSGLAVWAHYYTVFVLFVQFVFSILQGKYRKILPLLFLSGLIVLPTFLAPSFINRHWVDWIQKPNIVNLLGTAYALSGDFLPLAAIYGLFYLFSIKFIIHHFRKFEIQLLLSWMLFPIILSFLFSWFLKPIYQSVYFLFSLPPFIILSAVFIQRIINEKRKGILIIMIVGLSLVRLVFWYTRSGTFKFIFSSSGDWKVITSYVDERFQEDDAVIFYGYYNRHPYNLYAKESKSGFVEIASAPYCCAGSTNLPEPNVELLSKFKYKRVWLIVGKDVDFLDRKGQLDTLVTTLSEHYSIQTEYKGPEVEVLLLNRKES
jgi:uncharacterized membrane protein